MNLINSTYLFHSLSLIKILRVQIKVFILSKKMFLCIFAVFHAHQNIPTGSQMSLTRTLALGWESDICLCRKLVSVCFSFFFVSVFWIRMSGSSSLLSKKKKQVLALTRGNICLTSNNRFCYWALHISMPVYLYTS